MKRPTLKAALAKLQTSAKKVKKIKDQQNDKEERQKVNKKEDTRILCHQWSDGKRTLIPYRSHPGTIILIIGDGDFSFSKSLLDTIPAEQIIATGYDSLEALEKKYSTATDNIQYLKEAGVKVLHEFDGSKMTLGLLANKLGVNRPENISPIVRIIFNFPHTGEGIKDRAYNIRAQQKLIMEFFRRASQMLLEQSRIYSINSRNSRSMMAKLERKTLMAAPRNKISPFPSTKSKNCGDDEEDNNNNHKNNNNNKNKNNEDDEDDDEDEGVIRNISYGMPTPEIHLTCWEGDPYDDWNVKKLASTITGLAVNGSFFFDPARHVNYSHRRTIGQVANDGDDTFLGRPARTFAFIIASTPKKVVKTSEKVVKTSKKVVKPSGKKVGKNGKKVVKNGKKPSKK